MTRVRAMAVIVLVCAVLAGCSSPSASVRPGTRGQAARVADPSVDDHPPDAVDAPEVLPPYVPVVGLKGTIKSIGASTTTNIVARLSADFRRLYPSVVLEVSTSPITFGPVALLEGRTDLAPMSRPLTPAEVRNFTAKYGYPPTEIKVAADALAIYVGKGNPVPGLTLGQLDGIFAQAQGSGTHSIETWGQLGLEGDWADRTITVYGYGPEDGAHEIFRQRVLHDQPFRLSMRVVGGGSSIVQSIASDPDAIGFASVFFVCRAVRVVPLLGADGRACAPSAENVRNHRYPLGRYLYICVNKPPRQPLAGPSAEFLRFVLSREGQQLVAAGGNLPLDAATAYEGLRHLAR